MIKPFAEYRPIATIESRGGTAYEVHRGYDERVVDQLIEKSKEPDIRQQCHRDADSRFVSRESFEGWVTKNGGRFLYPLIDARTEELGGIIWLGAEPFTGEGYESSTRLTLGKLMTDTYAVRTYESAQEFDASGKRTSTGLAKPFTRIAITDYVGMRLSEGPDNLPDFTGIHLETDIDNVRARQTYENLNGPALGFIVVGESVSENRVAMALPLPDINAVLGVRIAA